MSRRRRDLRPDERELWRRVEQSAQPLHPQRKPAAKPVPKPETPPAKTDPQASQPPLDLTDFTIGGAAAGGPPARQIHPSLTSQPVRMDAKAHRKMTRGKMEVEGRIDLHGLTLNAAHPRLMSFVFASHAAGKRLVLVITGKGRDRDDDGPIPERRGILRQQVPQWLNTGAVRSVVLQVTQAHQRHGGSGAFYVYLRRK